MHRIKEDNLSDELFYSQDRAEVHVGFVGAGGDIELNKFELHVNDDKRQMLGFLNTL